MGEDETLDLAEGLGLGELRRKAGEGLGRAEGDRRPAVAPRELGLAPRARAPGEDHEHVRREHVDVVAAARRGPSRAAGQTPCRLRYRVEDDIPIMLIEEATSLEEDSRDD